MKSRRNFLEALISAGFLTGAAATPTLGKKSIEALMDLGPATKGAESPTDSIIQDGPHDAGDFWDNFFRSVEQKRGTRGPKPSVEAQDREVQYLHFGERGLRYVNDVKRDELLDYSGDVVVSASLGQYRPGDEDNDLLHSVKSSQLRVDFVQSKPLMNILAPMAWAALAVFAHDKPGKLPSLDSLGYKKPNYVNGVESVLLPGGLGRFAVNVSTIKPESTFHKILRTVIPAIAASAPVLNLPAISVPVLKTITEIFLGPETERRTTFLLNSLPAEWIATQHATTSEARSLPLVSGNYVMVPQAHTDEFGKEMPNLVWDNGYLVPKDTNPNQSLPSRAGSILKGVTYVTMKLTVTPAPTKSNATEKSEGEKGDGSSGASDSKKKTTTTGPTKPPPVTHPTKKP